MKNVEYLFESASCINHKKNQNIKYDKLIISGKYFDSSSIFKILEHFNWMIKLNLLKKVKIHIKCDIIADDATLIIFESIIYHMIKTYNIDIEYTFDIKKNIFGFELYKLSNLYFYDNKNINKKEFITKHESKLQIEMNRYKRICVNSSENRESSYLSTLYDDICNFLKYHMIKKTYYENVGEVICEILNNNMEHSDGDSILDIKTCNGYRDGKECKFLNVTIVSYTKTKFGEKLKDYLLKNEKGFNDSNKIVKLAYNNQKEKFSDNYDIDDFVIISSFQKNVTTRKNSNGTGGKGLTLLIDTLINSALYDYCYILNGKSMLYFKHQYLNLSKEGTIGFNEENDYVKKMPNMDIFNKKENCFNGTIYNLSFILEGKYYE